MQVADDVHRLTQGVVNFYLIEDGGGFVVVDAGVPADWSLLVPTVSALGRGLRDLEAVLITHAHSDHIGFAERARETAGGTVWIHEADAEVAKGAKPGKNDGKTSSYLLRAEFYRTVFSLVRRGATKIIPIQEVSTVRRRRDAGGAGSSSSRACARAHAGQRCPLPGRAARAAHRRRAGDEEPVHRPSWSPDDALGA